MIHDATYSSTLENVLHLGEHRTERTGVGTRSLFGVRMCFDMEDGFPLLTTKKLHWKSIVYELLWFFRGDKTTAYLRDHGVTIWDEWASEDYGVVGPMYGHQWRAWRNDFGLPIDQLDNVIKQIKTNPTSRRHVVSAWNPADLEEQALPPCHIMFQFYVRAGKWLDLQMYQRSGDMFLGVPFNIASYSLLLHIVAKITGLTPGMFTHVIGDAHIYSNHIEQVKTQLDRSPAMILPSVTINDRVTSIDDITFEDIILSNYYPHPAIPAPVAV